MAQPGAIMVAVGAGHLAGKESVLEMLKQERLQGPPAAVRPQLTPLSIDKCSPVAEFR